ncbi:four helix bundle protein [Candidatus Microgenomates bacterium]|jgi:four helix bundle protein|nr:MAG: four helix bundle protein [Candidatus Microgenomates bacterium]
MNKILNFYDLDAWKEGRKLVLMNYKLTENFPEKEKFCLVSQMNRVAISITSNIAEGFTRMGVKDKTNFYYMAKASLTELQNQFILAKELSYVTPNEFNETWLQTVIVHKLITGIIKGVNNLHGS